MSWSSNLDLIRRSKETVRIIKSQGKVTLEDKTGHRIAKEDFHSLLEAKNFCDTNKLSYDILVIKNRDQRLSREDRWFTLYMAVSNPPQF